MINKIILLCGILFGGFCVVYFLSQTPLDSRQETPHGSDRSNQVQTEYLQGFYKETSFFRTHHESHHLLYNHRPNGNLWRVSLRGKLLESYPTYDNYQGVHLVEQHGDYLYAIIQVRGLHKLTKEGKSIWYRKGSPHHDIDVAENGDLYTFQMKKTTVSLDGETFPVRLDHIFVLDSEAEEKETIDLHDQVIPLLSRQLLVTALEAYKVRKDIYDIFHMNSLQVIPMDLPGVAKKGDLLISLRNLDLLIILDRDTKEIIWEYGTNILEHQHHATVTTDGNILVFDNGVYRKRSRALKIAPRSKEIVWRYEPQDDLFFTKRHGSAVELPNGNVLISLGRAGKIYEVDMRGELVAFFELTAPGIGVVNPYRLGIAQF